ncbi:MAG: NAD(+)/NADH kinase [Caldilineales bacterium]|nr:NAD(+)/NADH kinase [Caldilineales bacterium]MCW5857710.1 NAD(+)/NADH kinase [Caldilineales bacterium]
MRIGILHHPKIPASHTLAADIQTWLHGRGQRTWVGSAWNAEAIQSELADMDLLITLGGDGTLLRAGRVCAKQGVPILGVNLGRLGFLAEIQPADWQQQLPRMLAGDYWLEERLMLKAEAWRGDTLLDGMLEALNDVVVSRSSLARVVRIAAEVNGSPLTTYVADGIIVATPTGSTAYALAAGGPILPPDLRNILLLAIAPHLSLARPLVLDCDDVIGLQVQTDHAAILTVDGQFLIDLQDGDRVVVTSSPHMARFVRIQPRSYFYKTLIDRLKGTI